MKKIRKAGIYKRYSGFFCLEQGNARKICCDLNIMMWVSKVPNYDAYGLFRALHSHNPPQYSHIVGLSSHFYAHIGSGPKVFHPPMSKLMWI